MMDADEKFSCEIEFGHGGYHLVVYKNGDPPKMGRWYGSREECIRMSHTPHLVTLYQMRFQETPDPFDIACERRYD